MWTSLAKGLLEDREEPEILNSIDHEHFFESENQIFIVETAIMLIKATWMNRK